MNNSGFLLFIERTPQAMSPSLARNEPASSQKQAAAYMPQLDGLRAIAVIAVMISHFAPIQWLRLVEPWGPLGVRLFFVLSGFLITGILLKDRVAVLAGRETGKQALRRFYVRRTLRIFPLFYATILATAAAGIPAVRDTFWWHMAYLSNLFFALHGDWYYRVSHFWSLGVEEQFYLAWPFLMLWLPDRALRPAILVSIAIGPLARLAVLLLGGLEVTATVLPFSCLDSLGLGALLAYLSSHHYGDTGQRQRFCRAALWVGLPASIPIVIVWTLYDATPAIIVLGDLAAALFFVWLIGRSAAGAKDWFGRFMAARPLRFIGQISYSLYITHNFLPIVLNRTFTFLGLQWSDEVSTFWQTSLLLLVSFPVAMTTFRWIERPFRDLRSRFEDDPKSAAASHMSASASRS